MSDTHAAKKPKTTTTGPPLYPELDLAQLTVDTKLQGSNETRFATVKYKDARPVFQMAGVSEAMRAPFGIDDGSKFGNKPSLKIELREPQRAFFQDVIEAKVKEAAVLNKATWFGAIKPLPDDAAVRASFNARVQDDNEKFPPGLKLNISLSDDKKPKVNVLTTRRLEIGAGTGVDHSHARRLLARHSDTCCTRLSVVGKV